MAETTNIVPDLNLITIDSEWFACEGPPISNLGTTGDMYLDKISGDVYGPKNNNSWGSPISSIYDAARVKEKVEDYA